MKISPKAARLIFEWQEKETLEAKKEGMLGFIARAFVQVSLPYRKYAGSEYVRRNGNFKLTLLAPSEPGLPYGSIPRLLLAWISTEAVKTKSSQLILGSSLSEFMSKLDLVPTGGRWGSITRLRDQMTRLASSTVNCKYTDNERLALHNVNVIDDLNIWWQPKNPNQATLWESTLELNEKFFNEIIEHPVPVDLRAIKSLRQSPLSLDIYAWLTYRMSYLKKLTNIPWEALQMQFGSDYKEIRFFRRDFKTKMAEVLAVYPCKVALVDNGIRLSPSPPHIKKFRNVKY